MIRFFDRVGELAIEIVILAAIVGSLTAAVIYALDKKISYECADPGNKAKYCEEWRDRHEER